MRGAPACALLGALLFLSLAAGCSEKESAAKQGPRIVAVPVIVAPAVRATVPLDLEAVGNAAPYATVAVKARVDGQIVKVFFREGEDVKAGQPLFQLDARPYQALLQQSEATLARDEAQMQHARKQKRRYKELLQKNFVSPDAYAQFVTNADSSDATVRADQAAVESAKLQVEYTTIRAPISGRTGKVLIQLGNLVRANDTNPLVVINQVSPIYVDFSVPEQYLDEIRGLMRKHTLPVTARISGEAQSASGTLAFVDNAVDTTTGTVRLRARFANRDRLLWPGQFVTAVLTLGEERDAVVVPSQAVETGPDGQFVFVVKPGNVAEVRPVKVKRTEGGRSVIASGIAAGEQVVITGQIRLTNGVKVEPSRGPAPS